MRRRPALSFALILGLVAVVSTAPTLLAKQDQDEYSFFHEGISVVRGQTLIEKGERLQSDTFTFDHGAYIPERIYPTGMVVKVQKGTFAFRVQSDVLVDPQGADIQILEADSPIPVGSVPGGAHSFTANGPYINNCAGTAPTILCLLNPAIVEDQFMATGGSSPYPAEEILFVQLEPGFTVYLPDDTMCFFCNTTGTTGDDTSPDNLGDQAALLVWSPTSGFSWYDAYQESQALASGTPVAQGLGPTLGWWFNPGSPCH